MYFSPRSGSSETNRKIFPGRKHLRRNHRDNHISKKKTKEIIFLKRIERKRRGENSLTNLRVFL